MGNIYMIGYKTLLEKEKLLIKSNFYFSHNVFKSCLSLMRQSEYLWSKELIKKKVISSKNVSYGEKLQASTGEPEDIHVDMYMLVFPMI